MRKYIVSMAVDGRVDIEVEADDPTSAFEEAKEAFTESDLSNMEVVDAKPVNCYDVDKKILEDYNG